MLREQRQHVIEEADSRVDLCLTGPIQVERQVDGSFGGLPMNIGGTRHEGVFLLANG